MRIGLIRKYENGNVLAEKIKILMENQCNEYRVEGQGENPISLEELKRIVEEINQGDEIMVCEIADLGLNLGKMKKLFDFLDEKKVNLIIAEGNFHTREYLPQYLELLALLEKNEYELNRESVLAGLHKAKKKGRVGGRPVIAGDVAEEIKRLHQTGQYSYRKIAEKCGVSLGTVTKYVKEQN